MKNQELKLKGDYVLCNVFIKKNKYNKITEDNLISILDKLDNIEQLNKEIVSLSNGINKFKENVKNDNYRWGGLINQYNDYYNQEKENNEKKIIEIKKEIKEITKFNNIVLKKCIKKGQQSEYNIAVI